MKPAPMFLDRNFKRLAKVSNYLPPFGFKTQGKDNPNQSHPVTALFFYNHANRHLNKSTMAFSAPRFPMANERS